VGYSVLFISSTELCTAFKISKKIYSGLGYVGNVKECESFLHKLRSMVTKLLFHIILLQIFCIQLSMISLKLVSSILYPALLRSPAWHKIAGDC